MYTLIHSQIYRRIVVGREAISLVSALVVAEVFYKFGSFMLEAVGFIATWYAIGGLASLLVGESGGSRD